MERSPPDGELRGPRPRYGGAGPDRDGPLATPRGGGRGLGPPHGSAGPKGTGVGSAAEELLGLKDRDAAPTTEAGNTPVGSAAGRGRTLKQPERAPSECDTCERWCTFA